jgi:hypothetical protein
MNKLSENVKNQFIGMLFVNVNKSKNKKIEIICQLFGKMFAKKGRLSIYCSYFKKRNIFVG